MKSLFQIKRKGDLTQIILNSKVFSDVDVIDDENLEQIYVSLRIRVRKRREIIYDDTLTQMIEESGLAHRWNVNVSFLWIDFYEKTVVLHLGIDRALDNLDRELLGLPLQQN